MHLLLISVSTAATLTVGGSSYATIADAIEASSDGDRIEVPTGTWYECIDFDGKSLVLVGAGSGSTTLDGAGFCETLVTLQTGELAVEIEGMTLQNTGKLAISLDAGQLSLTDVNIQDVGMSSTAIGGVELLSGDLTWSGGTVSNATGTDCAGLMLRAGTTASLEDIVAYDLSYRTPAFCSEAGSTLDLLRVQVNGTGAQISGDGSSESSTFYGSYGLLLDTGTSWSSKDDTFEYLEFVGIYSAADTLTVDQGLFSIVGTGISIGQDGTADLGQTQVSNSSFNSSGSAAVHVAGGIASYAGELTLTGNTFSGNKGEYAGAVYSTGALKDTDSFFEQNKGDMSGAIYSEGALELDGSEFVNNGYTAVRWESTEEGQVMTAKSCVATDHPNGAFALTGQVYMEGCRFQDNKNTSMAVSGPLTLVDTEFLYNKGLSLVTAGQAQLSGVRFIGNEATAVTNATSSSESGEMLVEDCWFESNFDDRNAGAIYSNSANVVITDSWFLDNQSEQSMGAVSARTLESYGSYYCGNDGAVVMNEGVLTNNIFADNANEDGPGAIFLGSYALELTNNTFVGNSGTEGGIGYIYSQRTVDLLNNIFADTSSGYAFWGLFSDIGANTTATYNIWWNNSPGHAGGTYASFPVGGFGNQEVDPGLSAWSDDGDCLNDAFGLLADSAALNLGDPSLLNSDGSRSHIGATGGAGANWTDLDGDGWLEGFDCDDTDFGVNAGADETCDDAVDNDCDGDTDEDDAVDAQTWYRDWDNDGYGDADIAKTACTEPVGYTDNPNDCNDRDGSQTTITEEIPYDGIDQDCEDGDLADVDGDGFEAVQVGGPDCDDADPEIHPDAEEILGDDIDQNCDGEAPSDSGDGGPLDAPTESGCSGCALGGGTPNLEFLLVALLGLVATRRRS